MAVSQKYASLPDIDQTGHDVFETAEHANAGGNATSSQSRGGRRYGSRRRDGRSDDDQYDDYGPDEDDDDDSDEDDGDYTLGGGARLGGASGSTVGGASRKNDKHQSSSPNDELQRPRLDPAQARERFRDATTTQSSVQPSIQPARKHRSKRTVPFYPPLESETYVLGASYADLTRGAGERRDGAAATAAAQRDVDSDDPIARLRRLRFEADEIEELLLRRRDGEAAEAAAPSDSAAEATAATAATGAAGAETSMGTTATASHSAPTSKAILAHVRLLRGDLGRMEQQALRRAPPHDGAAPGEDDATASASRLGSTDLSTSGGSGGRERRRLIDSIAEGTGGAEAEATAAGAGASGGGTAVDATTSTASSAAARADYRSASSLARIDARLKELEDLVGVGEIEVLDENKRVPRPLLPSVARIEHLLSLVAQPRHLDGVSRRVKVLVTELERLHEARRRLGAANGASAAGAEAVALQGGRGGNSTAGGEASASASASTSLTPDTLARLEEAFGVVRRAEPLLPLASRLSTRLRSLASLHESARWFGRELTSCVEGFGELQVRADEMRDVLGDVARSVEENAARTARNAEALEARMAALTARVEKLGG